ncbi:hypothetical protein HIM_07350 [Hirsutella minnesotensis 3608]|uniref:Uncharacterized protein n=1 Tax=Hirsutella minnesotensis 3608 TaxID=1043627 RepID=A0A0F7ZI18_9HYPO|nr:hypothetical protein HIM_07350 [Hirsutella minnesotensis 3608]
MSYEQGDPPDPPDTDSYCIQCVRRIFHEPNLEELDFSHRCQCPVQPDGCFTDPKVLLNLRTRRLTYPAMRQLDRILHLTVASPKEELRNLDEERKRLPLYRERFLRRWARAFRGRVNKARRALPEARPDWTAAAGLQPTTLLILIDNILIAASMGIIAKPIGGLGPSDDWAWARHEERLETLIDMHNHASSILGGFRDLEQTPRHGSDPRAPIRGLTYERFEAALWRSVGALRGQLARFVDKLIEEGYGVVRAGEGDSEDTQDSAANEDAFFEELGRQNAAELGYEY